MEVIVGKYAGFCPGVNYTVTKAQEILQNGKVYCLGDIIHNKEVIKDLENKGMSTVSNISEVPNGSKVIFRAHGEARSVYQIANENNLEVCDLTCPKVKAIHQKVEKQNGKSFVIIIGKSKHPEVIGTKGFCDENSYIVENADDVQKAFEQYQNSGMSKVYVVAQTTFSSKAFDELVENIKNTFTGCTIAIDKTICNTTEVRQNEVSELSKKMHKMIVIGGLNSSNTRELAKIAGENCESVRLIQTVDDIKNATFDIHDKVGIVAGASTPNYIIKDVKNYLESL